MQSISLHPYIIASLLRHAPGLPRPPHDAIIPFHTRRASQKRLPRSFPHRHSPRATRHWGYGIMAMRDSWIEKRLAREGGLGALLDRLEMVLFQHMDDLKVALRELKQESDSGKLRPAAPVTARTTEPSRIKPKPGSLRTSSIP